MKRSRRTAREVIQHNVAVMPDGCWLWTGAVSDGGYGRTHVALPGEERRNHRAHRLAYEAWRGPIPDGLQLDHFFCSQRSCVNPWHLEAVTGPENHHRARKTHCKRGHPLSGDNLRLRPQGGRACVACRRIYHLRDRLKSKATA